MSETNTDSNDLPKPKSSPRPRRSPRSPKPKRSENISQEKILLALKKKKECNAKALKIVEDLIEPIEDRQEFVEKLKDINQCHFEDIVEERAITKKCGYPLCKNELADVPKKQYHISTKSNKIYDITERKNFCSTDCFKASNYVKEQLLTSPLWLRDQEDIPEFHLLSLND